MSLASQLELKEMVIKEEGNFVKLCWCCLLPEIH